MGSVGCVIRCGIFVEGFEKEVYNDGLKDVVDGGVGNGEVEGESVVFVELFGDCVDGRVKVRREVVSIWWSNRELE